MFTADSPKYSQDYAITVTLHPKVRKFTAEQQYDKFAHDVVLIELLKLFPKSRLSLVCELTKSYDIHFHGIISFNMALLKANTNVPRWFRDKFRNQSIIGFVLCKVIDNKDVWIEYILKSLPEFNKDMQRQGLITDDYGIASPLF